MRRKRSVVAAHRYPPLRLAAYTLLLTLCAGQVAPSNPFEGVPIYVLEVNLPDRSAADQLSAAGLIIDDVRTLTAEVYATPEQRTWLDTHSFTYRVIGQQPTPPPRPPKAGPAYHTYATLTTELQAQAAAYPEICRFSTLGQSVQGRELWALKITDNPDVEEDEPEFKYLATMHGDEPVGTETCMFLINRLLTDYGTDPRITDLINETEIWFVPLMNPDGLEIGWRFNANTLDLNRTFPAFPDDFAGTLFDGEPLGDAGRPPEVGHVMRWTADHTFVLSANFHTGALVVNYPYDDDGKPSGVNSPTPDDALFRETSHRYAVLNTPMFNNPAFPGGITNGAVWFVVTGGMQDWNYRFVGCNEVTIELSNVKRPDPSLIPSLWADNEEAMLTYLEQVHIGIRGLVTDAQTGAPIYAKVLAAGNPHPVFTDPQVGDYQRMLLPGTYALTISAPGYTTQMVADIPVADGPATRVDVTLELFPPSDADVNNDGFTDAVDVQLVINSALGIPATCACDLDGNGVAATDVQTVINAALGQTSIL
ncbi:MAG: carboxypeptidase regulatory-like domain-containing protein [Candidatus Hydrogenedentes bacterium]|nr:carboxypeptidase regulatory-like domain-containing protein [Candidatus Hydrogenedentota bacterium]